MARVTIEDCVTSITNRFRLVMCSAQRGRELASGVEPTVERDRLIKHEKGAVIALREIAQGNLDVEALEDSIVRNHRRFSPIEEVAAEEGEEGEGSELSSESPSEISEILPEIHAEAIAGAEAEESSNEESSDESADEGEGGANEDNANEDNANEDNANEDNANEDNASDDKEAAEVAYKEDG